MRAYPAGAMKCVCVCIEENRIVERSCVSSFSHVSLSCVCLDRVIDDIIVSQVGVCVCVFGRSVPSYSSPRLRVKLRISSSCSLFAYAIYVFSAEEGERRYFQFSRSSIRVSAVNQAQLG